MKDGTSPVLRFRTEYDEQTAWEAEQKGWFEGAVAVLPNGAEIALSFWDPVRLSQELSDRVKSNGICFAEPGLVIVPAVNRENMEKSLGELAASKYFDRLVALAKSSQTGQG